MQTFWIACSYSLSMFPLHESAPTTTVRAKRARNRNDICYKVQNVCNFLNIILDWLALFQMCFQTMYTDEWPNRGIPSAAQWNDLCGANVICGFAQTILGFEQICYALELGDEEEQHREEWGRCEPLKVWWPLCRMQKNLKTQEDVFPSVGEIRRGALQKCNRKTH